MPAQVPETLYNCKNDPSVDAQHAGWHAVRWIWGRRIAYAWVLTFPGGAVIGALGYWFGLIAVRPFIAY